MKDILSQFGSSKMDNIKFRDSYVLVGESGLPGGMGIEKVHAVNMM